MDESDQNGQVHIFKIVYDRTGLARDVIQYSNNKWSKMLWSCEDIEGRFCTL